MIYLPVRDMDFIFLSYDEPYAEKNWHDLLKKVPTAKRVHGVKGFDAVHKEAARISETERFFTVDADTVIDEKILDRIVYFSSEKDRRTYSWASYNEIVGIHYGNGSLKLWHRDTIMEMKSHENADADMRGVEKIEFCWTTPYISLHRSYSITDPGVTPIHTMRVAMREGAKMTRPKSPALVGERDMRKRCSQFSVEALAAWIALSPAYRDGLGYFASVGAITGSRMALGDEDLDILMNYEELNVMLEERVREIGNMMEEDDDVRICPYTGLEWSPESLERYLDEMDLSHLPNGFRPLERCLASDMRHLMKLENNRKSSGIPEDITIGKDG